MARTPTKTELKHMYTCRFTDYQICTAKQLGNGHVAEGVRVALNYAASTSDSYDEIRDLAGYDELPADLAE